MPMVILACVSVGVSSPLDHTLPWSHSTHRFFTVFERMILPPGSKHLLIVLPQCFFVDIAAARPKIPYEAVGDRKCFLVSQFGCQSLH